MDQHEQKGPKGESYKPFVRHLLAHLLICRELMVLMLNLYYRLSPL